MKRRTLFSGILALLMASIIFSPMNVNAQGEEESSPFDVGADLVSSYVWRGTKYGTGPAIQPYLSFAAGGFEIGGWGNYCFTSNEGAEADIYLSYGFDFGLSIGLTDYYFPGTNYFDVSDSTGAHALEINLAYEIGGFSVAANYMLNEAGGAGAAGGDMYFELGYGFKHFSLFAGAGDGWHSADGNFALCNLGISAEKEIKLSENFSLPVSGALIWNPDKEQYHVVVGISF
jgi:hypothetical protein